VVIASIIAMNGQTSLAGTLVSVTAQTKPVDRRRTRPMDSYSLASAYAKRRRDLFNRDSAGEVWRRDANAAAGMAGSIADEKGKELPRNWMHRGLARVRRQST
jgi:hypothetical protein